jgi:hypothetical protein
MRIIPAYGVEANFLIIARLIISISISVKFQQLGERSERSASCGDA